MIRRLSFFLFQDDLEVKRHFAITDLKRRLGVIFYRLLALWLWLNAQYEVLLFLWCREVWLLILHSAFSLWAALITSRVLVRLLVLAQSIVQLRLRAMILESLYKERTLFIASNTAAERHQRRLYQAFLLTFLLDLHGVLVELDLNFCATFTTTLSFPVREIWNRGRNRKWGCVVSVRPFGNFSDLPDVYYVTKRQLMLYMRLATTVLFWFAGSLPLQRQFFLWKSFDI